MEKKEYMTPVVCTVNLSYDSHLLDWSAPKATGGGNVPEGKQWDDIVDDEEEEDDAWNETWGSLNSWEENI